MGWGFGDGRAEPFAKVFWFFSAEKNCFLGCAVLNLLVFSTLYPNPAQPNHGVFVENRLRHLVATGEVTAEVLAPVAWFPGRAIAGVPAEETRHGLRVRHPRWLSIPAIGMRVAPFLLYCAALRAIEQGARDHTIERAARYDAIDAHYFYPDGVAATWLGRRLGLPVVITARGSDVTQFPDYPAPRRMILRAAREAAAVITVSAGLRNALIGLGADGDRITVLRNGVDLSVFRPMDLLQSKAAFGVTGRTLVSVGALIERKGHDRTIAALPMLPGWTLLIAGAGPERARLEALAARLGVADRVRLLGSLPHGELAALYSAADLSVLASSREGWANVLLESMACGTAVVASPIPGNPEVVAAPEAGLVAKANTAEAIANAVREWEVRPIDRGATRAYAERFGWDETSAGQLRIFRSVIGRSASA
jgi:glycosyltransferase involved in cell wall biosynthesis